MKEEVARIMRLVQEGKLSPEDAAELIDAFTTSERNDERTEEEVYVGTSGSQTAPPPPPPPAHEGEHKDPFKSFVDMMDNLQKEVTQNVNWHDVAQQIRRGAQKG